MKKLIALLLIGCSSNISPVISTEEGGIGGALNVGGAINNGGLNQGGEISKLCDEFPLERGDDSTKCFTVGYKCEPGYTNISGDYIVYCEDPDKNWCQTMPVENAFPKRRLVCGNADQSGIETGIITGNIDEFYLSSDKEILMFCFVKATTFEVCY